MGEFSCRNVTCVLSACFSDLCSERLPSMKLTLKRLQYSYIVHTKAALMHASWQVDRLCSCVTSFKHGGKYFMGQF